MWLVMAVLSAVLAGLTAVLAKCGIRRTDPDVATAVRTVVVLLFAWLTAWVTGAAGAVARIGVRPLLFLILSGLATGASWLCYFRALSGGDVHKVAAIDKSSAVLTVLLAIVCFGETAHLAVKLIGAAVLAAGILLMAERRRGEPTKAAGGWMAYAVLSAVFAAATSILAKIGITGVDSNLGTAIRTGVVAVMAWLIVLMKGKQKLVRAVDRRELLFLALSGLATGGSWLCYYYAIQNGVVSVVVPIDKMSILITVAFSCAVLKEKLSRRALAGLGLMAAATLVMAVFA